jgi:hypothetical protein
MGCGHVDRPVDQSHDCDVGWSTVLDHVINLNVITSLGPHHIITIVYLSTYSPHDARRNDKSRKNYVWSVWFCVVLGT